MFNAIKRTSSFIFQHPLAKKHIFQSFYKFFYWQIVSSFSTKLIAIQFVENTKFWAKKKLTGITGNIYSGLHEFEDMSFLIHFLRKDDIFFDVGANVGCFTILASGLKEAKTIAFEPIESTFDILEKNVKLNNLEQIVQCKQLAVGSKQEVLFFTDNQDTTNHCINETNANSTTVNAIDLDHYFPEFSPILLKIDVEGFETEVINGANNILRSETLKAIIIELNGSGNRYGYDEAKIHEKLLSFSFYPFQYDPFQRKLNKKESYGTYNTIYIKNIDFVKERVLNAKSFTIFKEKI